MTQALVRLAELWIQEPGRPQPERSVLEHWDRLICEWADDPSLPLYVRKSAHNRGSIIRNVTGRSIVPTDNSPAQWALSRSILGDKPTLEQVRQAITDDQIPVAMILTTVERSTATFRCVLKSLDNPNEAGWKVAHVDGVGLANKAELAGVNETVLRQHFRKLMSPSNMFVVPLKYAGLGELPEFCQAIRALLKPE
jgi:hypothetical protein